MYCRKCGSPNQDDAQTCVRCNAPLPPRPGTTSGHVGATSPTPPGAPTTILPPPLPGSSAGSPFGMTAPPPPPAPVDYGAPGVNPAQMNILALVSLISSLLSLFFCCWGLGVIPAGAGVVMGYLAQNKIKQTGERGRELAMAGLIIGGVGIGLNILMLFMQGASWIFGD